MNLPSKCISLCVLWVYLPLLLWISIESNGGEIADRTDHSTQDNTVTFNRDIAPILFQHCVECHRPGASGPFLLMTYKQVRKRARQVAEVTESRFMPPWLPEPEYNEFVGERLLTPDEIAMIKRWVEQGTVQGDPEALPPLPQFTEDWQLGEPDLVVEMSPAYTLQADGTDVWRNMVIPIPVSATHYVEAVELRPGNKQIIHHAVLNTDDTGSCRHLDEQEPGMGFSGMEMGESISPDGQIITWTPGMMPIEPVDGMAWLLKPGMDFVLQLHMLPSGKPELTQPIIGLHFTEQPPTLYPYTFKLFDSFIDIPAGKADYVITDEFRLPVDLEVLFVYPHAHYLARDMQGFALLPDGSQQWLIRIKDWDFNWQDSYRYRQPIFLPKGTLLKMKYTYDNSENNPRNPNHPPKRVQAGNRSSDEMGHLWFQVLPQSREDREILKRAHWEDVIQKNPNAAWRERQSLAIELQKENRIDEAVMLYQEVLRINPDYPRTHFNLGLILLTQGKQEEAAGQFRKTLQLRPNHHKAHFFLGQYLGRVSRWDEAIEHFQTAVRIESHFPEAYRFLGDTYRRQDKIGEAVTHYRLSLQQDPHSAQTHSSLAGTLAVQGRMDQAIEHFRRALEIQPKRPEDLFNLGFAYTRQGRLDRAIENYHLALKHQPDFAQAHYMLYQIYQAQNKPTEAQTHLKKYELLQQQSTP